MPVKVTTAGKLDEIPARLDTAIRLGLHTAGVKVAERAKQQFDIHRPKGTASGDFKRSITTSRVTRKSGWYNIKVGTQSDVKAYARFAHEKTGPQRPPPLKAIIKWLRFKPGTRGNSIRELYPLARAVQAKIAREGTSGFPAITTALRIEMDNTTLIIYNAIIAELRR